MERLTIFPGMNGLPKRESKIDGGRFNVFAFGLVALKIYKSGPNDGPRFFVH